MRVPLLLLLLVAIIPAAASAQEGEFTMLHLIDYKYLPDPLEVPPGHTVVVMSFPDTNKTANETEPHTVTDVAEPPRFDIRNIPPDTSQHPFTAPMEPGTYPYFCRYHGDRQGSGMVGTLIVTPAVTTTPATSSPTPAEVPQETSLAGWVLIVGGVGAALIARRR